MSKEIKKISITEKIEADKKKAVDDALKSHQAETNRIIAEEKAELNRLAKQEELPQKPVTRLVDRTSPSVEQIHSEEPENNPEKRTVTVLVTFEIQNVPSTASNKGVESMVKRDLSEKQLRAFKSIESLA